MSFPLLFLDQIKLRDFFMISGNSKTYRSPEIVLIFTVIVLTSEKVIYSTYQKQPPEVFCKKKVFLEISHISKHLCQRLFFNKVAGLKPQACSFIKKGSLTQVFSCKFCEISKNTFSAEHIWTTASDVSKLISYLLLCHVSYFTRKMCFVFFAFS